MAGENISDMTIVKVGQVMPSVVVQEGEVAVNK